MTQRLRIVFVTNNYTPYSGGVVSSIVATRAALEKAGHEVTIVTLDFLGDQQNPEAGVIRVSCPLKFTHKKNSMAVPWRSDHQVKEIIARIRPDIIHTHHPFLLGQSALAAARALNIPILFTYHTLYQEYAHYVPLPGFLTRALITKTVNRYCQQVDRIIAPSVYVEKSVQKQNITTPVAVVPSSVQEIFYTDHTQSIARNSENPFHLLCVSRFVKEKNIVFLLDVFAKLLTIYPEKALIFTLIGYGHDYEFLQSYAYQTLTFSKDQVRFIHKPDQATIAQYYRSADLFLFASHTDTQGLVLAEAMSGGMPVVALDGPGQRSIIQNGYNGFLVATLEEMVMQIRAIAQDGALHERLSQGAKQTAQQYTSENMGIALVHEYRALL